MFKLGYMQTAYVNRLTAYGAYISEEPNGEKEILLEGDKKTTLTVDTAIEVFVYQNKSDQMVASLKRPILCVDEIGWLKVVGKVKSGFFLDNQSERDAFMPNDAAKRGVKIGDRVLVKVLLDDRKSLSATMRIYDVLTSMPDAKVGDTVEGVVYDIKSDMGAFIAVSNQYHGFVPKHERYREIVEGAVIQARITKIREDGKVNLSIRQKASEQIHDDEAVILSELEKNNGLLNLSDHSDPEVIKVQLNMSKRAFKRAIGKLYKEGKIELNEASIKLR
ncbi:S1 RNA-binding domain-containing protein [Fusibacter paucivorans]|uniref:S1 RNA-binding domain-containing protein n=1 Tax=Fusibacter paucivorans TaxID=76009 RepID=A0ABS5PNL8_9FIRM|nr:S1-like domain-containing RNA-binding protein [Fusibacter paucivorans]MBS7525647.1 S1 RNA-binding domain-containing protein [Fusibacter paucivorans]